MGAAPSIGVYPILILTESNLISAVYADELRCPGFCAWFWKDRDPFCDVGKDVPDVGRRCDVFEECREGVAGGRGGEVGDDGLKNMSQGNEESGDVLVIGFAVLGPVGTDLDGF